MLDGNSLVHRAYHASDGSPEPAPALRGLVGYLARAAAQLRPDAVLVGFDCPHDSARRTDHPDYKAHRPAKPAELTRQLQIAPDLLRAAGVGTVVPPAYEADDVLASSAALARSLGWQSVLMTSDRDAFALIDDTTSVLRIRNGGFDRSVLVDAASLAAAYGVHPWQYTDFAALRGDPSDNLPGVRRFGARTAARLLTAFGSVDAAWQADVAALREAVGELAATALLEPAAREAVDRNRRLMRMRHDLPVPSLETARLPLDYLVIRRALREHGINLGPSLWALVGGDAPAPSLLEQEPPEPPPAWAATLKPRVLHGSMSGRRDPIPGQTALF
ncbi:DNA polymerase I [Actinoplanes sp. SE50]|nr:DNA polymerase I [Actinoplanes sp. SE50/110]ATO83894.1 DNA polymerase I [Actinoplanes sp. SE50]SLM01304.1 DNA polymerase I [Actinoplanes sp. SE50/110]